MFASYYLDRLQLNTAVVSPRRDNGGWRPPVPPRRRWRSKLNPPPAAPAAADEPDDDAVRSLQLQSPFFRLPAELRRAVYADYLAHARFAGAWGGSLPTTPAALEEWPRPAPALARACRRLRAEVSAEAGGTAALRLSWHDLALRADAAAHGRLAWARVHTLHLVVAMTAPRLHAWAGLARSLLVGGACPLLCELVVHWYPPRQPEPARPAGRGDGSAARARTDEVCAIRRAREAEFLAVLARVEGLRSVVLYAHGPEADAVPEWWVETLREMGVRSVVRLHGDCEGVDLGFCKSRQPSGDC